MLQPYSKIDTMISTLINLHTIPYNDKAKTGLNIFENVFKKIQN
jgi:hypothetical protein